MQLQNEDAYISIQHSKNQFDPLEMACKVFFFPTFCRLDIARKSNIAKRKITRKLLLGFIDKMFCNLGVNCRSLIAVGEIKIAGIHAKNVNRKVHGLPQSQAAANPRHQEEKKTDRY